MYTPSGGATPGPSFDTQDSVFLHSSPIPPAVSPYAFRFSPSVSSSADFGSKLISSLERTGSKGIQVSRVLCMSSRAQKRRVEWLLTSAKVRIAADRPSTRPGGIRTFPTPSPPSIFAPFDTDVSTIRSFAKSFSSASVILVRSVSRTRVRLDDMCLRSEFARPNARCDGRRKEMVTRIRGWEFGSESIWWIWAVSRSVEGFFANMDFKGTSGRIMLPISFDLRPDISRARRTATVDMALLAMRRRLVFSALPFNSLWVEGDHVDIGSDVVGTAACTSSPSS
mmetsp:Transcript_23929/g.37613  ORF Transcript_23929/g.37613 Transcript_23929/m.37613 type:complete len:282 (+) Transcript_23929:123-968(+)